MQRRSKAVVTGAVLSAALAELLTGSSPPFAFFNPALFALYFAMYGSGVHLARDFVVRHGKGPASLVALGLAYAIFEEALVLRTWFDPASANVQLVGDFGRIGSTNVVWAVWVTPWLALLAIWIPCFGLDLLFPDLANQSYLAKRGIVGWWLAGGAVLAITLALPHAFLPGPAEFGAAVALIMVFVWVAFKLEPDALRPRRAAALPAGWPLLALGAVGAAVQFEAATLWRQMGAPAMAVTGLIVAVWVGALVALPRLISPACWRRDVGFFFAGVVVFFAGRAMLLPGPAGMQAVGGGALLGLYALYRQLRRTREQLDSTGP